MTQFSKNELQLDSKPNKTTWAILAARYQTPSTWKSVGQISNTFLPFFLLWYLMYLSLDYTATGCDPGQGVG